MIGFNHAASGALIAKYLPLPLALPIAFGSHFVLDALPHYGIPNRNRDKSMTWKTVYVVDFVAAWGLAALAFWRGRPDMFLGGFVACSPDFLWVGRVIKTRSFNLGNNRHRFSQWHARIQRFERPWGLAIELPLAAVLFYFFLK